MKEASGELSMTAVAVVAIAAIAVVFSTLIWPTIRSNILRSTYCSQAYNCVDNGDGSATCTYCANEDCSEEAEVICQSNTVETD